MTFLPIVERELRVASRRRGTYWTRLWVALLATLIGSSILIAEEGASTAQLGGYIFDGLAGLSLLYCLLAGRLSTADCLSEEKREGTLGLLFLTDLRGFDVVMGKLAATSLNSFFALLAVFPVLAVPLVIGGVTNGEFARMSLLLADTFLFSLTVGIFASSLTRESRNAFSTNFVILLWLVFVLPAAAGLLLYFIPSVGLVSPLFYSCPGYAFYYAFDVPYQKTPMEYWIPVAVMFLISFLLVLCTGRVVPRSWQDKPAPLKKPRPGLKDLARLCTFGGEVGRIPFRRKLLDQNAFYWLAARARLKPRHVWIFLGLMGCWWAAGWLFASDTWLDDSTGVAMSLILNCGLKNWITIEAGQRLAEDQRSGALELLLTTPLSDRDMVRGQMLALKRQFLRPVVVVFCLQLLFLLIAVRHANYSSSGMYRLYGASLLLLVADCVAASWVAMAAALTAKSHTHATLTAMFRILMLPWIGLAMVVVLMNLWALLWGGSSGSDFEVYLFWWLVFGLVADGLFGFLAWRRLRHHFYDLATKRFAPVSAGPIVAEEPAMKSSVVARPRRWWLRKRIVLPALGVILLMAGLEIRFQLGFIPSKAIHVSLGAGNAPFKVSTVFQSAYFVFPDGTAWHWGRRSNPGLPLAAEPERMDQDHWGEVSGGMLGTVGLRADGTLWQWGRLGADPTTKEPLSAAPDWVAVSRSFDHTLALKKDGTIWAWGNNTVNQMGSRVMGTSVEPIQVGRLNDWTALVAGVQHSLALRRDGTIWAWGQFNGLFGGARHPNLTEPTRICSDTNWTEICDAGFPVARDRNGDLWLLLVRPANPDSPASSTCRKLTSGVAAHQFALANTGQPSVCVIRPNGTLWQATYSVGPTAGLATGWHQVGQRKDWKELWGSGNTAFGITADGTFWTWGVDLGRGPSQTFSARLKMLNARIQTLLGSKPSNVGYFKAPIQEEPRPLVQFDRLLPP